MAAEPFGFTPVRKLDRKTYGALAALPVSSVGYFAAESRCALVVRPGSTRPQCVMGFEQEHNFQSVHALCSLFQRRQCFLSSHSSQSVLLGWQHV